MSTSPQYKILTYTGAVLDHTITSDAIDVYTKQVATDGIGSFTFTVPVQKGGNSIYDDIALHDKVKIYFGYSSIPANPHFVGYVTKIDGPLTADSGYIRKISGLDLGEILLRRIKSNKYWMSTALSGAANRIINDICSDLSLNTTDVDADASTISYEVRAKTYFDVLRDLADYWVNGGTQFKYDFWVDWNNDLNWQARPARTTGVESFSVGTDIISYRVTRDILNVKNNIDVYGSAEKPLPDDYDGWTESSSGDWTLDDGDSIADDGADFQVGSDSLRGYTGVGYDKIQFHRDLTRFHIESINELHFWRKHSVQGFNDGPELQIYAPDNTNYFEYTFSTGVGDAAWREIILALGPDNVYDSDNNTTGDWVENGSPNWWSMEGLEIFADFNGNACYLWIDGLYFFPDRWYDNATDAASITSYGQRDLIVKDDKLHSDSSCQQRSEALLFQRKDPLTQIEISVPGNMNVLLGDRLSMTIPAENISVANYDVMVVEHFLNGTSGFLTRATLADSANIRQPSKENAAFALGTFRRLLRELGQDWFKVIG